MGARDGTRDNPGDGSIAISLLWSLLQPDSGTAAVLVDELRR
jgi:hypothetical protein